MRLGVEMGAQYQHCCGAPCRLRLEAQTYSQLPQPSNSVTLMLTATADRLQRLEALCRSWPFPVTVAAYVPLLDTLDQSAAAAAMANATAALQTTFDR